MVKSISHGISALGAFGPRADMGPLGLICHAIWILARIILYVLDIFCTYLISNDGVKYTQMSFFQCPALQKIFMRYIQRVVN